MKIPELTEIVGSLNDGESYVIKDAMSMADGAGTSRGTVVVTKTSDVGFAIEVMVDNEIVASPFTCGVDETVATVQNMLRQYRL